MKRIGPKMRAVAEFVRANPGCTKRAAAERVGPNGSRRFGYEAVNRTLAARLIENRAPKDSYTYALYVVED